MKRIKKGFSLVFSVWFVFTYYLAISNHLMNHPKSRVLFILCGGLGIMFSILSLPHWKKSGFYYKLVTILIFFLAGILILKSIVPNNAFYFIIFMNSFSVKIFILNFSASVSFEPGFSPTST